MFDDQLQFDTPKRTTINNSERTEKDFHFNEKFTIENWNLLQQDYFQTLSTNNGVKFKFLIRKMESKDVIKFLILKEVISKQCLSTIEIVLTNPILKKKITRQLQHNFSIESRIAEIAVDLSEFQTNYDINDKSDPNKNKMLLINLTIDHHSNKDSSMPATPVKTESRSKKNEELFQIFEEQVPRIRRQTPSEYYTFTADQYCGIRNQGSTCFLNSILQAFFHLPIFRRLLFQMDVDKNADQQSNIIWNLRQLFAQMSETTEAVSTRQLTNAFGWNDNQVVDSEQDLFEFYGRILNLLEEKLKKTRFEGEIRKIFYGRARNYIRCLHVSEDKSTIESFNNISLEIRKFKNIEESLREHIKPELQIGENCIQTNSYGLQEAEIGVEYLEFPLVIYFRLNRIDYNPKKGKTVRNNSKCEFPISIDMAKYLASDSPQKDEDMIYELFGVLVHAGEVNSGHFYAFLRTNLNDGIDKWYRFNDSQVSSADRKQAVIDNFGGKKNDERQHYSAYILIYMRRKELPNLFCPVDTNFLSGYINDTEKGKKQDEGETIMIELYTINHIDPETLDFIKPNELKVPLNYTFEGLFKAVSKRLKMSDPQMFYCYKNNIFGELEYSNEFKVDSFISSSFFVENFNGIRNDILIFIEFFSPFIDSPKIRLLKSLSVSLSQKIFSVLPVLESFVKIRGKEDEGENFPYLAYICNHGQIREVSLFSTFGENLTNNGSFFIFQLVPQKKPIGKDEIEIHDIHNFFYNNNDLVQKYYDHFEIELPQIASEYFTAIGSSINLTICDVFVVNNESIIGQYNNEITISIPEIFSFDSLKKFIVKLYNIDFNEVLQKVYIYKKNSVTPIVENGDKSIKEEAFEDDEKLHILVTDDFNRTARIELMDNNNPSKINTSFFNSNLVASYLFEDQNLFAKGVAQYRLLQINMKKQSIKNVFDITSCLYQLKNPIKIDIVPEDQKKLAKGDFLIKCRNVILSEDKFQNQKPIPSPFLFKVIINEFFGQTRERFTAYIEFRNNLKFILLTNGNPDRELFEDDVLSDLADESSQIVIAHPKNQPNKKADSDNFMTFG